MKTPKYFALKSVGHFLPGMAINVELSEERVKTLTKSGFITTEKPDAIVKNEKQSKLASKNAGVENEDEDVDTDEDSDENEDNEGDETSLLESGREKLKKGKRLTIPEIKAVLDDEFVEYPAEANHGELMKLVPSKD